VDEIDTILVITNTFLALAAFFSILINAHYIRQAKEISNRERKDVFLPNLYVDRVSLTLSSQEYSLYVNICNDGNGSAIYQGFTIESIASGGDMGINKIISTNGGVSSINLLNKLSLDSEIIEKLHKKELKLKFIDVFGRDVTLVCKLFVDSDPQRKRVYTKTITSRMILPD